MQTTIFAFLAAVDWKKDSKGIGHELTRRGCCGDNTASETSATPKNEDVSVDPQNLLQNSRGGVSYVSKASAGEVESRRTPEAHWPASLAKAMRSALSKKHNDKQTNPKVGSDQERYLMSASSVSTNRHHTHPHLHTK